MVCKDCLHYETCFDWGRDSRQEAELCKYFVDKSKVVHLPCKVGDQVFSIIVVGGEPTIVTDYVSGFIIVGDMVNVITNWYLDGGEWEYNIFPTQEDAKKALEKRKKKEND